MGIEFFEGVINDEQIVIPKHQRMTEIGALKDGDSAYTPYYSFWMDGIGKLWIDRLSAKIDEEDISSTEEEYSNPCIRVMKLPVGYIVDISEILDEFRDTITGELSFQPQVKPTYAVDGYAYEPEAVIGLLTSVGEVEIFRDLLQQHYGFNYPTVSQPKDS